MTTAASSLMARVRTRNTAPELALRRALHARGARYRLHEKHLPGSPDLVFPRQRLAVFVNGCFWHGCETCDRGRRRPKANAQFWEAKIEANRARDKTATEKLIALGWRVATVWECAIRKPAPLKGEVDRILEMRGA